MGIMVTQELVVHNCWCGIQFAIPNNLERQHRTMSKHNLFCPLGHSMVLKSQSWWESEIADLKLKVQGKDNLLASEREQYARLEKRIQHGVCPYCKRTFANIQRHMACKHLKTK